MSTYPDDALASRFAALAPEPLESDWLDVKRRARRADRRRTLTLLIAAALTALLVGSALALGPNVVDFFSAEPAPASVVKELSDMKRSAKLDWGDDLPVRADQARTVMDVTRPDGQTFFIAVAPASMGDGFCYALRAFGSDGAGEEGRGCVSEKDRWYRLRPGGVSTGDPNDPLGWHDFAGWVGAPGAKRVVVRYEDGSEDEVPVVWVGTPIDAGFFAFNPAAEHLERGHRATEMVALDSTGRVVGRSAFTYPDPDAPPDPWRLPRFSPLDMLWPAAIDEATAHALPITGLPSWIDSVQLARGSGGFCYAVVLPPDPGNTIGMGTQCVTPTAPARCCGVQFDAWWDAMVGGRTVAGLFVRGIVPARTAVVELRFEDGRRTVIRPHERVVFYSIPADRYPRGHRLVTALLLDRAGKTFGRRTFEPDDNLNYRHPRTP